MHSKLIKTVIFKVDGKNMKTKHGDSLLQACFTAYIDIPRFCYHEGLRIAGNCRMCLVEVANSKKLIASCATPLVSSFSVFTKTFRVKRARQAILEFLLINHPLDCPICDQGGECDLQDITLIFGGDRGRFYEISKRAVFDKNLGPLIKTIMNRCIHCTRCVRFFKETSPINSGELGLLGRGSSTEIGTYMPAVLLSELSGNVIDLCPVGALTSKPFAFKARTWELYSQYSYDAIDCIMPRIKFDLTGKNILRVLPYMGIYNSGWITNRTRFCYDALNIQRESSCLWNFKNTFVKLTTSLFSVIQQKPLYINITWKNAFSLLLNTLINNFQNQIFSFISGLSCLEHVWVIKHFFQSMGNHNLFFEDFFMEKNIDMRSSFVIDLPMQIINDNLWHVLLLGVNLRMEAPLLYLQFKKLYNKGFLSLYQSNSSFNVDFVNNNQLGITMKSLIKLFEGRSDKARLFINKFLFYKYLILINLEVSYSPLFSQLVILFERFFNFVEFLYKQAGLISFLPKNQTQETSAKNTFYGVIQRYVGNISITEIGLSLVYNQMLYDSYFSNKRGVLNFFYDATVDTQLRIYKNSTYHNIKPNSILFNSSISDLAPLKDQMMLVIPFKGLYEEDQSFLDVFLHKKISKKILPENILRKNLEEIFTALVLYSTHLVENNWLMSFFMYFKKYSMTNLSYIMPELCSTTLYSFSENFYTVSTALFVKNSLIINTFIKLSFILTRTPWFILSRYKQSLSIKYRKGLNDLGLLPVLNFYKDSKINLVSFSKTMRQSSFLFEETESGLSFSLHV